jgi:hypothetical protein
MSETGASIGTEIHKKQMSEAGASVGTEIHKKQMSEAGASVGSHSLLWSIRWN